MTTLLVCAVMDSKVAAFSPPMYFRTKGEAIRSFLDAVGDETTSLSKHPNDYQLFLLGSFEDQSGLLTATTAELLVSGAAVKAG